MAARRAELINKQNHDGNILKIAKRIVINKKDLLLDNCKKYFFIFAFSIYTI